MVVACESSVMHKLQKNASISNLAECGAAEHRIDTYGTSNEWMSPSSARQSAEKSEELRVIFKMTTPYSTVLCT